MKDIEHLKDRYVYLCRTIPTFDSRDRLEKSRLRNEKQRIKKKLISMNVDPERLVPTPSKPVYTLAQRIEKLEVGWKKKEILAILDELIAKNIKVMSEIYSGDPPDATTLQLKQYYNGVCAGLQNCQRVINGTTGDYCK